MKRWIIGGCAVTVAGALPVLFLWPPAMQSTTVDPAVDGTLTITQAPPLARVYDRPLFAPAQASGEGTGPADAPKLTGIAGRLNRDAVAMVLLNDGRARSLSVGQSVDGWRLESLSIDAALFSRGREQVRVAMEPASEDVADPIPDSDQ